MEFRRVLFRSRVSILAKPIMSRTCLPICAPEPCHRNRYRRAPSFASGPLDHQDARFATGMGDMFIARLGVKDVPCFKMQHMFVASDLDMHVDTPVKYRDDFRAVLDVPAVGLVTVASLIFSI